jgi:glycosyltransferase involved in cell wall biosynthesis
MSDRRLAGLGNGSRRSAVSPGAVSGVATKSVPRPAIGQRRVFRHDVETDNAPVDGRESGWRSWQVVDIDLARPVPRLPANGDAIRAWGGAWILLRIFDEPVGSMLLPFEQEDAVIEPEDVVNSIPPAVAETIRDRLREAGVTVGQGQGLPVEGCEPVYTPHHLLRRQKAVESGPAVTAIICTRNEPRGLARCLESLQAQSYPRTTLLVVDNASSSDASRRAVEASSGPFDTKYAFEAAPGLSNARNRAIREISTDLVAWIDDDEIADPHWLTELVAGFVHNRDAAAVCGVIVPAELATLPQYWFEEYGGHSKGRGFIPAVFSPATRHLHNPLFPLPPFGTGANMSMTRTTLIKLGGFDPALGAGAPTFGAEDTKALSEVLLAGGKVLYQPSAVTRHFHRRDYEAFARQLSGYGTALTAFYTSLVWDHPNLLPALLRLMPRALRQFRDPKGPRLGSITATFPKEALLEHRRGMVRGPAKYARARIAANRASTRLLRGGTGGGVES